MNKLGFLLLAAFSATSALAGEVGAPNLQLATAVNPTVAIADTGVSTSLMSTSFSNKASADRLELIENFNDQISAQVSEDLEQRIAQKLKMTLSH